MNTLRRHTNAGETRYDIDFELGYLDKTHVYVYAGTDNTLYESQLSYIWVSTTEIELTEPTEYGIGTKINVRRVVPNDALYVIFKNDVGLLDESLNNANLQSLMILEEVDDGFKGSDSSEKQDLNMGGFKIINTQGGEAANDVVTVAQLSASSAGNHLPGFIYRTVLDGSTSFIDVGISIDATYKNMAVYLDGILQFDAFPCDDVGDETTEGTTTYVNIGSTPEVGVEVYVKSTTVDGLAV